MVWRSFLSAVVSIVLIDGASAIEIVFGCSVIALVCSVYLWESSESVSSAGKSFEYVVSVEHGKLVFHWLGACE